MLARPWLLPILALLSACNAAVSDKPMFSEDQRSANLVLADGLWIPDDPTCKFDSSQPKEKWPKCATWVILQGGKAIKTSDMKPDEPAEDVFIADGRPPILQIRISEGFGFGAFEAKSFGADGKITGLAAWMVKCGVDVHGTGPGNAGEIRPYPGFDAQCHPSSADALRAAAAVSRPPAGEEDRWTWVRAEAK